MPSTFDEHQSHSQTSELNPQKISILDWNIYKGQGHNWERDLLDLAADKDIILLQEASMSEKLRQTLAKKKLFWNFNSAFKYRGIETGVLMASTIQPVESCGLRYSEPIIGLPKTSLISKYLLADSPDELWVVNTHSINITLGTRAYQAQLKSLQQVLAEHDGPLIVAGDFNDWSEQRTDILNLFIEELSLRATVFKNKKRTTFFGTPVDHVLYRGLVPIRHEVHTVTSSDHNAISVTFHIATN